MNPLKISDSPIIIVFNFLTDGNSRSWTVEPKFEVVAMMLPVCVFGEIGHRSPLWEIWVYLNFEWIDHLTCVHDKDGLP